MLTRDQILGASDLPTAEVNVPAWGGKVLIQGLSAADMAAWVEAVNDDKSGVMTRNVNSMASMVVLSVVDKSGKRLFKDEDRDALARKNKDAIRAIYDAAKKLNGITEEDRKELEKNSEAEATGDSSSGSPATSDAPSENS